MIGESVRKAMLEYKYGRNEAASYGNDITGDTVSNTSIDVCSFQSFVTGMRKD